MVSKDKEMKYLESKWFVIGFSVMFGLLSIIYGITLNLDEKKADKTELEKVEKKTDKNCENIEKNRDIMYRVENTLMKVETLLNERTK